MLEKLFKFIELELVREVINLTLIVVILFILIAFALTGCTTTTQVSPVPDSIILPEKPRLPIKDLNKNSSDSDTAYAYIASLRLCTDRNNIIENRVTN